MVETFLWLSIVNTYFSILITHPYEIQMIVFRETSVAFHISKLGQKPINILFNKIITFNYCVIIN